MAPRPGGSQTQTRARKRPRGRPPKGRVWNGTTGEWDGTAEPPQPPPAAAATASTAARQGDVAVEPSEQQQPPQQQQPQQQQQRPRKKGSGGAKAKKKRPRGRAPQGMDWDGEKGEWVGAVSASGAPEAAAAAAAAQQDEQADTAGLASSEPAQKRPPRSAGEFCPGLVYPWCAVCTVCRHPPPLLTPACLVVTRRQESCQEARLRGRHDGAPVSPRRRVPAENAAIGTQARLSTWRVAPRNESAAQTSHHALRSLGSVCHTHAVPPLCSYERCGGLMHVAAAARCCLWLCLDVCRACQSHMISIGDHAPRTTHIRVMGWVCAPGLRFDTLTRPRCASCPPP
jgi:hypothetical protein